MTRSAEDNIALWRARPDQMVRDLFDAEPDPWQQEALEAFPHNQRMALKACKGPGKTSLLSWLAWNFLLTRPEPKIAATSISGENLADNLWTEMAKWQKKSKLLSKKFEWTKTRIFAKESPETWWMSARRWSRTAKAEELGNTLAGLHADYILFILDEAGGIPDAIMASAEAALSSPIEGHLLIAGNPTHLEGPLYRACTSERTLWYLIEITGDPDSPKRSPRISAQWAREQILKYGRDDPWVLVNVFGQFPPSSINALIGPDEIEAAMNRVWREYEYRLSPKVLGIDVAREGDDLSVIFQRQGIVALEPSEHRNLSGPQGAGLVARRILDWGAEATFIDNTGGFGSSWIDALRLLGHAPIAVGFSEKASDARYANKRTEMYFDAVKWIKEGGSLPRVPQLTAALTQTTYSFKGDAMILEPKEIIKAKLRYSPDHADAFVLTFAQPVSSRTARRGGGRHQRDWDPNEAYSEGGHT